MAEYISRASLMGKLTAGEVQTAMREMDGSQAYSFFLNLLNSEPAAAVVEVTRCCDCTYWGKTFVNGKGYRICPASGMDITETDYCSWGERRENDG